MDIGTISSRYAKALFSLAKEKGQEKRVYDDMKMLADSFSLEPELRVALGNPIIPAEEKRKLLTAAGGIEVSDLYERFIRLVLGHKRENLLLFMAHIYIHLYRIIYHHNNLQYLVHQIFFHHLILLHNL